LLEEAARWEHIIRRTFGTADIEIIRDLYEDRTHAVRQDTLLGRLSAQAEAAGAFVARRPAGNATLTTGWSAAAITERAG
jgi:hypothetical protein